MKKLDCANCKSKDVCEDCSYNNQQIKEISWIREIICFLVKFIFVGMPIPVIIGFTTFILRQKIQSTNGIVMICMAIMFVLECVVGAFFSGWLLEKIDNIFYK